MATDVKGLVDADRRLVDRRVLIDEDIYQQKLESIFARCWLLLCHQSQAPNPGDFLATYRGEDPVLVWRDCRRTDRAIAELLAYEEEILPEVQSRLGDRRRRVKPIVGTVFPDFSMIISSSRYFRV